MIPKPAELRAALRGSLLLARFDPAGLNCFDRTLDGFWKSFFAAILVGPLQLLLSIEIAATSGGTARVGDDWLLGLLAFIVHWLAFPVAMLTVADWLDRRNRYFVFVVALNWSNLLQVVLLLIIYNPIVTGLLSPETARFIGAIAFAYILVYEWYIAKVALDVTGPKAMGLVLLDSFIGFAIFGAAAIGSSA